MSAGSPGPHSRSRCWPRPRLPCAGAPRPGCALAACRPRPADLVALALLAFGTPATMLLASQPVTTVASVAPARAAWPGRAAGQRRRTAGVRPAHPAGPPVPQVMSMGFYQLVTVRPGDCLWTIARHYLGDGDRFGEIVQLNMGHEMASGQKFTDPSVIRPGWVLQIPAHHRHQAGQAQAGHAPHGAPNGHGTGHGAHPSRERRYARPHPAAVGQPSGAPGSPTATVASPAGVPAAPGTSPGDPARSASSATATSAPAADPASRAAPVSSRPDGRDTSALAPGAARNGAAPASSEAEQLPPLAVFAAGMLAGGAAVALARMRHRQRQSRRRGRRIPLPASLAAVLAEQRIRAGQPARPRPAAAGLHAAGGAGRTRREPDRGGPPAAGDYRRARVPGGDGRAAGRPGQRPAAGAVYRPGRAPGHDLAAVSAAGRAAAAAAGRDGRPAARAVHGGRDAGRPAAA